MIFNLALLVFKCLQIAYFEEFVGFDDEFGFIVDISYNTLCLIEVKLRFLHESGSINDNI
jgi:hypothetical protein